MPEIIPEGEVPMKDDTVRRLNALDQEYAAEGADDLVRQLADGRPDPALEIVDDAAA
jgi:hypothetical protein